MARWILLLLLLAPAANAAPDQERLGTLIRWWLEETDISKKRDFLESIERLAKNDPRVVEAAIRSGAHRRYDKNPKLLSGGALPRFGDRTVKIQRLAESAGRIASLVLPTRYDPANAYPLIIDLGTQKFPIKREAVLLRLKLTVEQYPESVIKTEAVVLSLLVHLFDVVHVDPSRVYLQAEQDLAQIAWYIALHNPDRFAGVLGALSVWDEGRALARNSSTFRGLAIAPFKNPRPVESFIKTLSRANPNHSLIKRVGTTPEKDALLLADIYAWYDETRRDPAPKEISLVLDRPGRIRSFWLSAAPHVPSHKSDRIGRRWTRNSITSKATITARILEGNLIEVETQRIAGFSIYVDPKLLDPDRPIRVRINRSRFPESTAAFLYVEDLLDDYREHRDPELLYACRCNFTPR